MSEELKQKARELAEQIVGKKQFYVTEERAFAPGIADGWPEYIPAPHSKHGRLKRTSTESLVPALEAFASQVCEQREKEIIARSIRILERAEAAELALQTVKEDLRVSEFNLTATETGYEALKAALQAKEQTVLTAIATIEKLQSELAQARHPLLQLGRECAIAISGDPDDATDIGEDAELAVRAINAALKMGQAARQQAIAETCKSVLEFVESAENHRKDWDDVIAFVRSKLPTTTDDDDRDTAPIDWGIKGW